MFFIGGIVLGFSSSQKITRRKIDYLTKQSQQLASIIDQNNLYAEQVVNTLFEWDQRKYIQLNEPMIDLLLSLVP